MPSITPMMSAIRRLRASFARIVSTTSPTTWPPLTATTEALSASALACCALSAFCFTVAVNSSMEALMRVARYQNFIYGEGQSASTSTRHDVAQHGATTDPADLRQGCGREKSGRQLLHSRGLPC